MHVVYWSHFCGVFSDLFCTLQNHYTMKSFLTVSIIALITSSCVVVRQGEVAMKRRGGKLLGDPISERMRMFNPFTTTYIKVPVRNINLEVKLDIPSKEGLNIGSEVSILYRIEKDQVPDILREVGTNFEEDLISPVFRSALADVSSRFMAKDMHTGERAIIEGEVRDLMMKTLGKRGFIIDAVLMKRIVLPPALSTSIEAKLSAEQDAQRMEFVLEQQRLEAERQRISAEGVRDAQKILSQGLTPEVLRYETIEAFKELSKSSNAKIIITNGDTPLMLDSQ